MAYPTLRRAAGPLAAGTLVAGGAAVLTVAIARFWLGLPGEHVKHLARFFLVSGGVSLIVTLGAAWLLVREQQSRLAFKLGIVCVLGPAIAGINTYYTADNMLIKQADLGLLILLLVFSGSVGIAFALALARSLTVRIGQLAHAAEHLAGDSRLVAAPEGNDEVGALGRTLNQLAARLHESDARRRELEEARRLLLAAVSHDLRTPLTSLRVVVEALDEGVVQDPQTATRYLAGARQQIRQLETLIDDLFELARLDAGAVQLHRAPVAVDLLIDEAVESMRAQAAEAGIRLQAQIAPSLPPALLDSQRIMRVLLNLLDNALRYTPPGGYVEVRAARVDAAIRLSVQDSGDGIAAEDLPHVFERFYRGEKSRSRRHGGAGLGLAITQGLVEAHGGRIWAESAPDQGATISFTLPIRDA
ncbi:MAG TPA: ATP-binding protein [Chloroflexota bacterium]|nr:ATP-binding protein [Chloroflexota bacterium]